MVCGHMARSTAESLHSWQLQPRRDAGHRRQLDVECVRQGFVADQQERADLYFNNTQWKLIGHRGGGQFADGRARQYSYKLPTVNQVKFTTPIRSNVAFDVADSRFRALDVFGSRPEVKPGDIAMMDTTTQVSAVALPTYNTNGFVRELIRTNASVVVGSHDMRFGYEFNYNKRPSSIWSTSGLRANFANGVPTSVNTYLVAVTKEDASDGPDIPVLYTYREDNSGL